MPIRGDPKEALRHARVLNRDLGIEARLGLAREALIDLGPEERRMFFQEMEDSTSVSDPSKISKTVALKRFREALLRVAPAYYRSVLPADLESVGERVFAYELYHQLRFRFNSNFYVHGEFRKGLSLIPSVDSEHVIVPDIVVHQSESLANNLLAVEIKCSPAVQLNDLAADVEKLVS